MNTFIKSFLVSLMMLMSTSVFSGTVTVNGADCGQLTSSMTVDAAGNITIISGGNCGTYNTYDLTVTASGNGTITSDSGMSVSSNTSTQPFLNGAFVELTATVGTGANPENFDSWSGACGQETSNVCIVEMTQAYSVVGTFSNNNGPAQYTLNVALEGTGELGSVTATGISCGADCSETYVDGTQVTLTANANGDSFVSWSGCTSQAGSTCNVTMSSAKSVTATFNQVTNHQLTVNVGGTGSGSVASSPTGIINCSGSAGTCTAPFSDSSSVALTATPAGSDTVTWTGCTSQSGSTCNVTMTGVKAVDATFTAAVAGGNYPVLDWPSIPQRTIRLRGDEAITYQVRTSASTTLGGQLSTAFTTGTAANRVVTISTTAGDFNTASLGKCAISGSEVASVGWTQNPNPPFPFNIIGTCILSTDTTYYLNVKHTNCPANTVCEFYLSN